MRKLIYIKERRYTMKPLKLDRLFEELEDTGPDKKEVGVQQMHDQ